LALLGRQHVVQQEHALYADANDEQQRQYQKSHPRRGGGEIASSGRDGRGGGGKGARGSTYGYGRGDLADGAALLLLLRVRGVGDGIGPGDLVDVDSALPPMHLYLGLIALHCLLVSLLLRLRCVWPPLGLYKVMLLPPTHKPLSPHLHLSTIFSEDIYVQRNPISDVWVIS
jgi:hypothetical protein